jgi:hypothetical protein
LVSVPLLSIVFWDVLELKLPEAGAGVDVVDCVEVDVSEDELCATAAPVIIANAVMPASKSLVIWSLLYEGWGTVVLSSCW